jgi:hypothetical protein
MAEWPGGLATPRAAKEEPMSLDVQLPDRRRIEDAIASDDSPVGIDAKKTHVIIIQKLLDIERRLGELETRLRGGG